LLADVKEIFAERGADRLTSEELIKHLATREGQPWVEYKMGRPITQTQLAVLLKPFGVRPQNIRRQDGSVAKGYYLVHLNESFKRYLPSETATGRDADIHRNERDATTGPLQRYNGEITTSYNYDEAAPEPLHCSESLHAADRNVVAESTETLLSSCEPKAINGQACSGVAVSDKAAPLPTEHATDAITVPADAIKPGDEETF
jgi:hypothetical protein